MSKTFKLGCLPSALHQAQVQQVSEKLKPSGRRVERMEAENENALMNLLNQGTIDMVVMDATHLPLELPDTLELIACTERINPNDVVISTRAKQTLTNNTWKVGASSRLRLSFIKHYFPATQVSYTGNLQTLLSEVENGDLDMMVISYDEAVLLNCVDRITEIIETSYFTPAAGQGSLAVLCAAKMPFDKKEVIRWWVNHEETEDCIRAERSFLKSLPPTETRPVFSYAQSEGALITLKAGIISPDGHAVFKSKKTAILSEIRDLGKKAALEIAQLLVEHQAQSV
jgi:hydroxymethylbilane synthase